MRRIRWLSSVGLFLAALAGVTSGLGLALFSAPRPALADGLDMERASIVTWRGAGDSVPPDVHLTGWQAPIFYTTPAEGAAPEPPEGRLPTGPWAPGDTRQRTLVVRNVDPDFTVRLDGIRARLSGELELASWYRLTVRGPDGQTLYEGTLADFAGDLTPVGDLTVLPRGEQAELTFTVHLPRNADQRLQGKTVRADLIIYARPYGNPPVVNHGGPYAEVEGSPVTFDGTGSYDPEGEPLTYTWDPGDGSPLLTGAVVSHTYGDNGLYTVTVTVQDASGNTSSSTTTATIGNVNPAIAPIAGGTIYSGEKFDLLAMFTDPGWLDTHTASSDWGSLAVVESGGSGTASGTRRLFTPGTHLICVTVTDDDGGSDTACTEVTVLARAMAIDIHPNSWPNPINPGAEGQTPVAINGSAHFDVTMLDDSTARFGPSQAPPAKPAGFEDWNKDGYLDIVLHFDTQKTGITCGMTEASLTIAALDGTAYQGTDAIVTPACP